MQREYKYNFAIIKLIIKMISFINYYKFILAIILIAGFFLTPIYAGGPPYFTIEAAPDTPDGRGECYDELARRYFANASSCDNEGEFATDPNFGPGEFLCSMNQGGRFNMVLNILVRGSTVTGGTATGGTALTATELANTRNANCVDPSQRGFVARCLRSCKLCCKLPKYTICRDITPSCDVTQCTNRVYALTQCPASCGKCEEVIAQNKDTDLCADIDGDCMAKKILGQCTDAIVKKNCALTCNDPSTNQECKDFTTNARSLLAAASSAVTAPTGGVVPPIVPLPRITTTPAAGSDKAMDCQANLVLCNNPVYRDFMQENCQKTCSGASGTAGGGGGGCVDKPHTNCVVWKRNGFCENDFYTEEQKRDFCGNTCKLC